MILWIGQPDHWNCGLHFQWCWWADSIYPVICCQAKVSHIFKWMQFFFYFASDFYIVLVQPLNPTPTLAFQQDSVQHFKPTVCSRTVWPFRVKSAALTLPACLHTHGSHSSNFLRPLLFLFPKLTNQLDCTFLRNEGKKHCEHHLAELLFVF